MNKLTGILVLSLVLNAALAVLAFRHPSAVPANPEVSQTPSPTPATATPEKTPAPGPEAIKFQWSLLESDDYKKYIANLRAFGASEKVIRDIIMADIAKMYRPKFAAVRGKKRTPDEKFWEYSTWSYNPLYEQTKEEREKERELRREQNDLVKSLLGEDVFQQIAKGSGQPDWMEIQLGFVPPELRDKVAEIRSRYQDAESDLMRDNNGRYSEFAEEDREAIHRRLHDELAAILTPEQLKEYDLRNSGITDQMRYDLKWFAPNEQEFRAVFDYRQARQTLDSQMNPTDGPDPSAADRKTLWDKVKTAEDTLAQALGTNRAAEYKVLGDQTYSSLLDLGVSKESAMKIPDIRKQAESAAQEINQNKTLTPEQRADALKAVQAETQITLAGLLNEKQLKAYQQRGGWWLRNLAPRATR